MNVDELLQKLNPEQKKAVTAPDGSVLVLAGAGSGKTRILTFRIAYLIARGVPSFNILGVTFTNKAADEMKRRVSELVRQDVWVSTFHSTCLRILRIEGEAVGVGRNFSIYDDHDQLVLIKECLNELNKDERQINPKGIREQIQRAKDFLLTPEAYRQRAGDHFEEVTAEVYERYEKKLHMSKAFDFGDLIAKTVFLFDEHPRILESWQERFKHILIDEYQDTNHAQYRLVRLLAERYKNIMVVGDPDQSIYSWRGADIRNILDFEKDYPNCQVVKLEQNYRSTANVLDAANGLISFNMSRKPKELWTDKAAGEKLSIFQAGDEKEESHFVVQKIMEYQKAGRSLSDCVVFYRLHAQSRPIEDALRKSKIPYRIVGGIRFYDRKEIKDLIAYLKAIAFPSDDLSLKRILNVPNRGIGKKTLEMLGEFQRSGGIALGTAIEHIDRVPGIGTKAKASLVSFYRLIQNLRSRKTKLQVSELLQEIVDQSGYTDALETERTMEAQVRLENIQEFFSVVQEFEESWRPNEDLLNAGQNTGGEGLLEAFIESVSLVTDLDSWDGGSNSLTLMTLHCAKGLEFPIVFMVGMEEEIFPHVNSFGGDVSDLEEERRLCYVGMTRAKEKLYFVYADSRRLYGSRQHNLPSRFLNEIPSNLFEEESCLDAPLLYDEVIIPDLDELRRRVLFD
jgi:DNA helicase-2/ATP-dependent DNA helicase PcrA